MLKRNEKIEMKITTGLLANSLNVAKRGLRYKISIHRIRSYEATLNTIKNDIGMKIEVRNTEGNHKTPHFHVSSKSKDIDVVYKIDPIELYIGTVDSKTDKKIIEWAEHNRNILVDMWNDYHGYRIYVS